ncbi:hypothetical protein [Actinomyces sp. Z5]|uniref:hypothetical protein n=1 Tax=Actinomyces sp. Z5 TaxID=2250216 RepID=UPI0011BE0975|nr:hypothetical protein [Actinomyces sp. Z5]
MLSQPSSTSALAARAVAGEFLSKRTIWSSLILTAVAAWVGMHLGVVVNLRVTSAGVFLATAAAMSSIAWTWVHSERWPGLTRFPIATKDLARAAYLIGSLVVLLEVVLPVIAFISTAQSITWTDAITVILLALGMAPLVLLLWSGPTRHHRLGALIALAAGIVLGIVLNPLIAAVMLAVEGTVCFLLGFEIVDDAARRRGAGPRVSSLVLGELASSRMTQINTAALVAFGWMFNAMLHNHGAALPLGAVMVVQNTPLNAYFSRHPSTWLVVKTCPRTWRTLCVYALQLAALYLACGAVAVFAPEPTLAHFGSDVVFVVTAASSAALAAVLMEWRWPLLDWKSEREVIRHPRKYVPALVACILSTACWALTR